MSLFPAFKREGARRAEGSRCRAGLMVGLLCIGAAWSGAAAAGYGIMVSEATAAQAGWRSVVAALQAKHPGSVVFSWARQPEETLPALRASFPRHVCFVARPEEAGREFVARVHRLMRRLDADPYTDALWGILTGYDAACARRIALERDPLIVRKVAAGTEVALEMCEEGVWYSELKPGLMVRKPRGGAAREETVPADTTEALVRTLNEYRPDLFVTSGHATERDWQIGYAYRNGQFRCQDGRLWGVDTRGRRFPVDSPNPKVYLPVGNCLMGHIDRRDCMALAWMNSAGVRQMIGYTVPTWYGYAGWGCLDYFLEQPGRFTFAEAFFANQHALIHRLARFFPEALKSPSEKPGRVPKPPALTAGARAAGLTPTDGRGLLYDRDVVAFYGDPAWEARMAPQPCAWEQTLTEREGVWTLTITPRRGERTFEPINRNGAQRGGRPIVQFLPRRLGPVEIMEGAELQPVVTDDFVLVPLPAQRPVAESYRVVFRELARPATP
ncbi:MAG: hypothetical protein D6766_01430 [Verrucomicrobia bacterium]|nr:MAG: hypothetical protein D6766_01430 [Verrucomicrobiota bacterium]